MDIKIISLVILVFTLFLLTTIYLNSDSMHGHSHGPELLETEKVEKANSFRHETIK